MLSILRGWNSTHQLVSTSNVVTCTVKNATSSRISKKVVTLCSCKLTWLSSMPIHTNPVSLCIPGSFVPCLSAESERKHSANCFSDGKPEFDHICSHEWGFLFRKPPWKKRVLYISAHFYATKKSILRSTWNRCTFKKKRGKHLSWHHWHYQRIGSFLVQFHIHRSTSKFADPHQKRSSTVSAGWHDLILRLFASCFLYM